MVIKLTFTFSPFADTFEGREEDITEERWEGERFRLNVTGKGVGS